MNSSWEKYHDFDSKNPTFSSSLLDKINKSLKNNAKNDHFDEEMSFYSETMSGRNSREDEKMSSLRRACMVEKWMEKKVSEKVLNKKSNFSYKSSNKTLLEEFDVQDTLFFSTTSSSSSSSELDYSSYGHSRIQKSRVPACFAPPKPIRTRPVEVESKFLDKNSRYRVKEGKFSRSKIGNVYSNLKSLKQPVSPGVRLTSFINSLFTKDNNNNKKHNNNNNNVVKSRGSNNIVEMSEKSVPKSYSTCTTPSSYARSCLSSKNKKLESENGVKRTVKFCPVSVIVDEDSRPCGQKSLFKEGDNRMITTSKFARSLSKRYEKLRILKGLEKESCDRIEQQKKLEEVALDLLSGYWDSRLSNKSHHNQCGKDNVNDGNYGVNHGGNYDNHEDYDHDNDDGDRWSCSSSDLFELDHLSFIGNELPVYETTQFRS